MPRTKSFDIPTVVRQCCAVFRVHGYHAASIDDLVVATALKRGSLYQAFGSKLGIFVAALNDQLECDPQALQPETLDMLAICCLELPNTTAVRKAIGADVDLSMNRIPASPPPSSSLPQRLGERLLDRMDEE